MSSRMPAPPHRRRVDRVGGSVLALVGIAVAVIAVVALRHPNGRQARAVTLHTTLTATRTVTPSTSPSSHPSATHASSSTGPSTSQAGPHKVPLIVLNSTSINGLADTAKQRFEAGGWTVTGTDNIVNDIISTCAYYDPSDPANQQAALALQQQFPAIKRVKEKFAELPPGPVVVVLTTDYS